MCSTAKACRGFEIRSAELIELIQPFLEIWAAREKNMVIKYMVELESPTRNIKTIKQNQNGTENTQQTNKSEHKKHK